MIRSGAVNVNFQFNSANRTLLFIHRNLIHYTNAIVSLTQSVSSLRVHQRGKVEQHYCQWISSAELPFYDMLLIIHTGIIWISLFAV